jgi:hypothetical protein
VAKIRVFVSSVVHNFEEFREAARAGVTEAGGEPVLVNEDFPSLSASSRNACLDAVDSCDVYLGIIGERGGWTAPSGKLVVEEEYERAKFKPLPTLFFLQDIPRDRDAERFARKVSDYVDGSLRRTFKTSGELKQEVVRALKPHMASEVIVPEPAEELLSAFTSGSRSTSGPPRLRTVIAPERREEVIDPVQIGSPEFTRLLLELGHKGSSALFDYAHGKTHKLKGDILTIEEVSESSYGGAPTVRIGMSERGILSCDAELDQGGKTGGLMSGMVVAIDEIENALRSVLSFYAGFMDSVDAFKRHQRFFYNTGLLNLGYRTLERNPQPRTSHTMAMRSNDEPIVAHKEPRMITRDNLHQNGEEIKRIITLLVRNAGS